MIKQKKEESRQKQNKSQVITQTNKKDKIRGMKRIGTNRSKTLLDTFQTDLTFFFIKKEEETEKDRGDRFEV